MTCARRVCLLGLLFLCLLYLAPTASAQAQAIDGYVKVSEVRVSRTITEFTYRATLTTPGPALSGATATASSLAAATTIVDGTLTFGPVGPGGSVLSTDTFSFRQNRTVPFDWSHLQWVVTPAAANQAPVADAGPDQTVSGVNAGVTLDGSGSSDPDGDPLTYQWTIASAPAGSVAALASPTSVAPTFVADRKGLYVVQLIVNDGTASSLADTVSITVPNTAPVANAGPDITPRVTENATVDGSGSNDVDGDTLTFSWTFLSRPAGSTATLSDASAVSPTFLVDRAGTYTLQLVVNDGTTDSAPDSVTVTTENTPPVANAGPDQTVAVGAVATLNASGSSDVDSDPLTYAWSIQSAPAGSAASVSDPAAVMPTVSIDQAGSYVFQLIVNDGTADSAPDTVVISTQNSAPVANAGPNQTVFVTDTVTLDGSGSSDVDGDPLTFAWSFVSRPAGSVALLSDPAAVGPTFVADRPGVYELQLVVNDGLVSGTPDTVTIATQNSPPVANAGPDQTAFVTDTVTLDGSGSTDVDGDTLTYAWSLVTVPGGSGATLNDPSAVMPTFVADRPGTYVAQLMVHDGTVMSVADTVTIATQNSPPTANAGTDQTVVAGQAVSLDGSGSSDVDGDPLTFSWSFTSLPAGSTATLTNPASATPSFVSDEPGTYVVQLIVNDGLANSAPDTVTITTTNAAPVANAGPDQLSVPVGGTVALDGSGSSDANGHALTYQWSLLSRPSGSTAALSDPSVVGPTFTTDVAGDYVAQLIVNDGFTDSAPDTVLIRTVAVAGAVALSIPGNAPIGVGRTVAVTVTLPQPAPTGGLIVTVTSDGPGVAAIVAPGTTTIAEGDTTGQVSVTGVSSGGTFLRGDATGFAQGVLPVIVTLNLISTPSNLNVPLGQTTALPISIGPDPAPAGGLVIDVTSSSPSTIEVVTPQVTVPAGALSVNATLRGVSNGVALVTASRSDYSPSVTSATSSANLNILPTSISFDDGLPAPNITVQLESGGVPIAAPSDVIVQLGSSDTACVTVPGPVTIPAGLVSATFQPSYGGTASRPCTVTVTASGVSLVSDTVSVTVNAQAAITMPGATTLGAGLQLARTAFLGSSQHGGVTVTIESSDPTRVLVSPDSTTVGTASFTTVIPNGQTNVAYQVQGLENSTGAATVTVSAPGFVTGSHTVTVVAPGVEIQGLPTSTTSLSANSTAWYVQVGIPSAGGGFLTSVQNVRAGSPGFVVTLTNSNASVAQLSSDEPAATGQTVTKPIQPNIYFTQNLVAGTTYGLTFDPLSAGSTTVTVTGPAGVQTMSLTGARTINVTGAGINTPPTQAVGAGLQVNENATLGASQHGGVTVTVESSDPSLVLVSPNATTAGTTSFTVSLANGQTSVPYYLQGLENVTGTAAVTVSAPGFSDGTQTVNVVQPGIEILSLVTSTTTQSASDTAWYVQSGLPNGAGTALSAVQTVRAGSPGFIVTLTNSDAAVAQLGSDEPPTTGQTVTKPIDPGSYFTQAATAGTTYGLTFDPLGAGTTTVTVTGPLGVRTMTTNGVRTITVAGPAINAPGTRVLGSGLQVSQNGSLGASQHGGVTVTVQSSDPSRVLVSPNATTPGTASFTLALPNGQTAIPYHVQGVENVTGSATVTISAPGFTPDTQTVNVVQPGIEIQGLSATATNLSADDTVWYVQVGLPNAANTSLSTVQNVRAGSPGFVVTLSNSNATVAQLRSDQPVATGQIVTKPIQPNIYFTQAIAPGTTYGLAFDALANGTTTVTVTGPAFALTMSNTGVRTVTISTPTINASAAVAVGAGLQVNQNASLGATQHGGVDVTITSSAPGLVLVAPNNTTAGASPIVVPVANGATSVPFSIMGLENTSGVAVLTLSAPGFTNATVTVTVVTPGVEIQALPATISATGAEATAWYIQVGVPNASNTSLQQVQNVRFGGPSFVVTLTNSNAAAAQLRSDEPITMGQAVMKPIQPGTYFSRSVVAGTSWGLAFDPLAAGVTTVTASAPGAITMATSGVRTVTVNP